MVLTDFRELRSFGQLVEFQASRSLELLKVIDETLFALNFERDLFGNMLAACDAFLKQVDSEDRVLDQDGKLLSALEKARDAVGELHALNVKKRRSAADDPDLHEDDGVVEAFDEAISVEADLHDALNDLCWAVGEHDADLEKPLPGSFSSADELFSAIKKSKR